MTEAIERTLELRASPERVWRALTHPAELGRWFGESAEIDLKPGGDGGFRWDAHGRFAMRIEVLEPPSRLSWRWARDPDTPLDVGPSTLVEWTITPRADGGTTLLLRESGFASASDRSMNVEGWDEELDELAAFLEAAPAVDPRGAPDGDGAG